MKYRQTGKCGRNDQWALYKTSEVLSIPGAMGLLIAIRDRDIEVPRLYAASIGATGYDGSDQGSQTRGYVIKERIGIAYESICMHSIRNGM